MTDIKKLQQKLKIINKKQTKVHKIVNKLSNQSWEIEQKINPIINQKYVGRCYKYHNSYGSGDKWWLYIRVTGVDEDTRVKTEEFQESPVGMELKTDTTYMPISEGYKRITKEEYTEAKTKFLMKLGLLDMRDSFE